MAKGNRSAAAKKAWVTRRKGGGKGKRVVKATKGKKKASYISKQPGTSPKPYAKKSSGQKAAQTRRSKPKPGAKAKGKFPITRGKSGKSTPKSRARKARATRKKSLAS